MSASAFSLLFVSSILGEEKAPESFLGFHTVIPAFADEDSLNDPDLAPGLPVTTVAENSPAEKAGMEVGDRILRVDGTAPRTPAASSKGESSASPWQPSARPRPKQGGSLPAMAFEWRGSWTEARP